MALRIFALIASLSIGCLAAAEEPASKTRGGRDPLVDKILALPDAYPTLVNPNCSHCVDESKRRAEQLRDDDRVIAWTRGKYQGGAIPLRFFLVPYRVISDTYGVFVYDADAGYVRGYEPSLDFTFYGWRNGVMVIRHKDGTLFSALSGKAFDGPRVGEQLRPIATLETAWGHWLSAYPGSVAYNMFEKYQPAELPRGENADSKRTRLPPDPRLPADAEVLGVAVGDEVRAYPLTALQASGGVIADTIAGQPVFVLWFAETRTAAVYRAELEETSPPQPVTLEFDAQRPAAPFVDRETGSHWGIEGRAVDGPRKGKTLAWLPGVQCRWFAWAAEFPKTTLYEPPAEGTPTKPREQSRQGRRPERAVLVDAGAITQQQARQWAADGRTVAVAILDDGTTAATCQAAAQAAAQASLDLYYWIEVGRSPDMARDHPRWMAALGMHDDWRERFPKVAPPRAETEVAKAYPWVPIGYQEAFDAHLARIKRLLSLAAEPYRGLLLNDLQAGPASCGCGNLRCRWALDYHVPATATRRTGDDTAAQFVAAAQAMIGPDKRIVPVWTTECEDADLPANLATGGRTTGLCGSVPCSKNTCPKVFSAQWKALLPAVAGPVAVLALHRELDRGPQEGEAPAAWVGDALEYLAQVPPRHGAPGLPAGGLWVVVQGYGVEPEELQAAERLAARGGAALVIVALARIDQSYEPRIIAVP